MLIPMSTAWLVLVLASAAMAQDRVEPEISASNIVSAADYRGGAVAPSEIVVLYPSHAGPAEMVPWALDAAHMSQYSVDSLGGTRVLFDGIAAPMVYAKRGQICAIVPYRVSGKKTTEVVVEYEGRRSAPVVLPVVASMPALFTLDASGVGQAAMLNETGCCNSVRNPAVRGTVVSLYATGDGLPLPGGSKWPVTPLPVNVTVGGVPAQVVWTGNIGVLQVNVRIPANALLGDAVPLVLTVGNAHSSAAVTMAIRSARQQILVVANDPSVGRRLSTILTSGGYDVLTAQDGGQAADLAHEHDVDLVISDLARPGKENLEMMGAIRTVRLQVKTLAFADWLNDDTLKAADLLGAQGVLTKGLTAQAVLDKVRGLLRRRPAVY
jgi:uncharacterized protein (TIGR03437 family)